MSEVIERFNEFLMSTVSPDDWDLEIKPTVYARNAEKHELGWVKISDEPDPYLNVPLFVAAGLNESFESMMIMYGSMTRAEENDDDNAERKRVRVMIYLNGEEPVLGVQAEGETVFEPDDFGVGQMADAISMLIKAHKNGDTEMILDYIAAILGDDDDE